MNLEKLTKEERRAFLRTLEKITGKPSRESYIQAGPLAKALVDIDSGLREEVVQERLLAPPENGPPPNPMTGSQRQRFSELSELARNGSIDGAQLAELNELRKIEDEHTAAIQDYIEKEDL